MSVFLTSTGFQQKTLVDLRLELEASYRAVWGDAADLSPEGPLGQHIALMSKRDADMWEGAQEIYTSRDPDQATGEALDNLCAETGIERLSPTAASCPDVICWVAMNTETALAAGVQVKSSASTATYSLVDAVSGVLHTNTQTYDYLRLKMKSGLPDAPGGVSGTLALAINGTYVALAVNTGETEQSFLTRFAARVNTLLSGDVVASCESIDGSLYLRLEGTDMVIPTDSTTYSLPVPTNLYYTSDSMQGVVGDFLCDTVGLRSVAAYSLDTIATPTTNWLYVEQPVAGIDGTDTETDTALRLRRLTGMRSGTATEEAIRQAIYRVADVTSVSIHSNRTDSTDSEGRPAHSFEAVVSGGTDKAVATAIWKTMPAGIRDWGNISPVPTVTGADGVTRYVHFSRPVAVYAWAKVWVRSYNTEEIAPDDLVSAIQEAVATWGNANFSAGDDYVSQKLMAPIYTVDGMYTVAVQIGTTDKPSGTPTYIPATSGGAPVQTPVHISVPANSYLTFAASRVEVVLP